MLCIGISRSVFSASFCGLLTPFEYWIFCGLVPNSKCLFLDGTTCTFLLQLMLLSPCGLCQQTFVLRFTTQNSFAGQVLLDVCFSPQYTQWFSMWQAVGPVLHPAQGISVGAGHACLQAEPHITSRQLQGMQLQF